MGKKDVSTLPLGVREAFPGGEVFALRSEIWVGYLGKVGKEGVVVMMVEASGLEAFSMSVVLQIKRCALCIALSHGLLFVTPWARVHQAPFSMGFSSQEY